MDTNNLDNPKNILVRSFIPQTKNAEIRLLICLLSYCWTIQNVKSFLAKKNYENMLC